MLDVRLGRVREREWVRIGRGVHQRRDSDVEHLDLRAWQLVLPPLPEETPVFVAMPRTGPRVRRRELVVTRHPVAPAYVEVSGLRVTRDEIRLAARRRRGAPRLLEALQLSDAASESAWESVLRVLHHVCEVPVVAQHEVHDELGVFVARGDLWIVGWRRNGYTSGDVLHRAVGILRDADEALGRTHDPSRVRAWHELLRGSLFSAAGTRAVVRHWGRRR
ncbi:hypothetical protein I601_0251 [Nocardioides dokdonensis FR1436]|uniref:AbiEi antitoxin C-terminal domain-containing protein n=1 Tax=Nocardioides dokdonensis FR1436 TaxID=1300347 RepID=A0A1A9GEN7_9ACTN|nr:hypothetical protein I601_0251 [Nocardioides dokdonensis FR1436]